MLDVARKAGVSVPSVSAALHGTGRISAERREVIVRLAKKMRYQPKLAAQLLRARQTGRLGLIVAEAATDTVGTGGFWGSIMAHFARECEREAIGYHIEFFSGTVDHPESRHLTGGLVDGVLVAGMVGYPVRRWLESQQRYPWVSLAEPAKYCVLPAADKGMYEAVRHLAALGHRRIAYVGLTCPYEEHCRGVEGFRRAVADFALQCSPAWMHLPTFVADDSEMIQARIAWTSQTLKASLRPTAFVCHGVHVARAVIYAATCLRLDVPGDLSVVGYGMPLDAACTAPPLTCIEPDYQTMVRQALEIVRWRIAGRAVEDDARLVNPHLVLRHTVAAAPS